MFSSIPSKLANEQSSQTVADYYHTDLRAGLSDSEAERRVKIYGLNEFVVQENDPIWKKYLEQFKNPLILLLLCSAAISIVMRQFDDALSITIAIIIVVTVGFVQEYRSENSLKALATLVPHFCQCIRSGRLLYIMAKNLVPGDIVLLTMGDRIPADIRFFQTFDLSVDESTLTGETKAARKRSSTSVKHVIAPSVNLRDTELAQSVNSTAKTIFKLGDDDSIVSELNNDVDPSLSLHKLPPNQNTECSEVVINAESNQDKLFSQNAILSSHCGNKTISDTDCLGFMGTLVQSGSGRGIVIATGERSQYGEIFKLMQTEVPPQTPLQKSMDQLGKELSFYSLILISVIGVIGIIQGRSVMDMFQIGVSLAVAAIPEGLPIVVTVTLALGVMRMAKRKVIVKRLPTVETLGCVDVICCDKTGTLTQNQMTVTSIYTSDGNLSSVSGVGYNNKGHVVCNGARVHEYSHPVVSKTVEIGLLCNNAQETEEGKLLGQPTECALLYLAQKMNLSALSQKYVRLQDWPFTSENKWMAVKVSLKQEFANEFEPTSPKVNSSGEEQFFMKGALDKVISHCTHFLGVGGAPQPLTQVQERLFSDMAAGLGDEGLRVIGMAYGSSLTSLVFTGIVGIFDPPRPSACDSIRVLLDSGVSVKMLTGDSRETACAIGRQLGILPRIRQTDFDDVGRIAMMPSSGLAIGGDEIDALSPADLERILPNVGVLYRMSPKHKNTIVRSLQARGHVVAMTGDGVNDAVALRSADIGVAMGGTSGGGTDVCREAGDMILVEDDLATILNATEEGKCIFHNIRNFVRFQLSTSIAALCLVAMTTIGGLSNPLNAMQILWINILMDGPPAQSLGVEPVDPEVVRQPPRRVSDSILTRKLMTSVIVNAVVIVSGTLWVFYSEMSDGIITPRDTTMTFTCFVFFDLFNALGCRSSTKSIFRIGLLSNRPFLFAIGFSLLGQMLVIYTSPLQAVFQTEALTFGDLFFLVSIASTVLIVSEVRKFIDSKHLPPLFDWSWLRGACSSRRIRINCPLLRTSLSPRNGDRYNV